MELFSFIDWHILFGMLLIGLIESNKQNSPNSSWCLSGALKSWPVWKCAFKGVSSVWTFSFRILIPILLRYFHNSGPGFKLQWLGSLYGLSVMNWFCVCFFRNYTCLIFHLKVVCFNFSRFWWNWDWWNKVFKWRKWPLGKAIRESNSVQVTLQQAGWFVGNRHFPSWYFTGDLEEGP